MQDLFKSAVGLMGLALVTLGAMNMSQPSGPYDTLGAGGRLWAIAILFAGLAMLPKSLDHPIPRRLLGRARHRSAADRADRSGWLSGARRKAQCGQGQMHVSLPFTRDAAPAGWLGCGPAMPAHCPWPQIDGQPARFLAQLDCAQFPAGTWPADAPEGGQLAFFCGKADPERVRVLHLRGDLADRVPPRDSLPPGSLDAEVQRQARDLGRPAPCTRWPLSHCAGTDSDVIQVPDVAPFDWDSLFLTVALCAQTLRGRIIALTPAPGAPPRDGALLQELIRRQAQITSLDNELRRAAKLAAFSEEIAGLARTALERLDLPPEGAEGDHLLLGPDTLSAMRDALERHARAVLLVAPDALPTDTTALFAPCWAHRAARYPVRLGGPVDAARFAHRPNPVRLISIPSGGLTGWTFGRSGQATLHIHASADDIAAGDFTQTWGAVLD